MGGWQEVQILDFGFFLFVIDGMAVPNTASVWLNSKAFPGQPPCRQGPCWTLRAVVALQAGRWAAKSRFRSRCNRQNKMPKKRAPHPLTPTV